MRIFIDTRSLDARILSGIPVYTRSLIENLLISSAADEFLFFANSFKKKEMPSFDGNVQWINYRIPNRLFDFASRFLNEPKMDKLIKADVYWSPHFNILALENQNRHILTIHDLSPLFYADSFPLRKRLWHWQQNYRKQIQSAGRIVAVSEFTKNTIVDAFRISPERISVVHSGIDPFYRILPENDENLLAFRREKNLKQPFLLFVGTLEPRKNVIGIIRAFNLLKEERRFSDLLLFLVGDRGWLYGKILKEIRYSPYRSDIRLWGRVEKTDLLHLYNLASAFLYPSFFEGFGFPPLEAQACGAPVIASDRTSLPEILGKSALTVDPWKVEELRVAMEAVLLDNNLKEILMERGRKNAMRFSWKNAAERMMGIFREVNSHA